jgi:hypothetical protein
MSEPAKDEAALIKLIGQIIFYFGGEEDFFMENAEAALAIIRAAGWAVVPQTELDALRAENARLRAALTWFVENDDTNEGDTPMPEHGGRSWNEINAYWIEGLNAARAALEVKP